MKIIKRITAILLCVIILIPSVMLWGNLSFIKSSVFSVYSVLRSGPDQLGSGLSKSAEEIDKAASDYIGMHNSFVNIYGLTMRLCGSRLVNVGSRAVVKLDSGAIFEYTTDKEEIKKETQAAKSNAVRLAKLKEELDEQKIPLLFVLAPGKLDENNSGLPYNLENYPNTIADNFLNELDKYGVEFIDLREVWRQNGWTREDGFYYSDLHWRPEYALRSWGYVTRYLNDNYGIENDPSTFDLNNQNLEKFDNVALGSTGRIIGKYYTKIDGTELFTPKFDTLFHVVNERLGWDKTGTLEETSVDRSTLNMGGIFYNDLISLYRVRDSVVENKMASNDANVVFIRDSFGGMLGGYAPLAFKNTSIVDLRTMNGKSVIPIIDGFDTDLVIVFYNVGMVSNESMFNFD